MQVSVLVDFEYEIENQFVYAPFAAVSQLLVLQHNGLVTKTCYLPKKAMVIRLLKEDLIYETNAKQENNGSRRLSHWFASDPPLCSFRFVLERQPAPHSTSQVERCTCFTGILLGL